jgi:fatty-acyl-CoA synthase
MKALRLRRRAHQPHHHAHLRRDLSKAKLNPNALLPCYGMAEATLAISFIGMDETLSTDVIDSEPYQKQRTASRCTSKLAEGKAQEFVNCGKTFPGHEVGIFDDEGTAWPSAASVRFRCAARVAKGYFRDPDATERTFGGGWLKTGDLGYLANGNVYIVGRKKDIIIINGRNYDPQRLEWLVDDMAGVRKGSTVAFSKPGAASEELVIVLEARTNSATELEALKESVKQRIVEQMQLTPRRRGVPGRLAAQDLERQAAALEDAPAVPRRHRRQRGQPHHRLQRREGRAGPSRRALAARPFPSPGAPRRRARPRNPLVRAPSASSSSPATYTRTVSPG